MNTDTIVIAEVKPCSPTMSTGQTWEELFPLACEVGDWISIHTNPLFGGSMEYITKARELAPGKVILAKGFHFTDEEVDEALARGANYVLVVGRIPERNESQCLIEPYYFEDLEKIPSGFRIVWNSRDIFALINAKEPKIKEGFEEARKLLPDAWICQASNILTVDDVHPTANAVLIGTNLESFAKSLHNSPAM